MVVCQSCPIICPLSKFPNVDLSLTCTEKVGNNINNTHTQNCIYTCCLLTFNQQHTQLAVSPIVTTQNTSERVQRVPSKELDFIMPIRHTAIHKPKQEAGNILGVDTKIDVLHRIPNILQICHQLSFFTISTWRTQFTTQTGSAPRNGYSQIVRLQQNLCWHILR